MSFAGVPKRKAAWLALAAGLSLAAGCGEDATVERGATSMKENVQENVERAGQAVDDATLTTRVKAALMDAEAIDGGAISVSTQDGTVTLSGDLPPHQIPIAEGIVRGVDGVTIVDNRLRPTTGVS